jgi:hypothetical protein
MATGSEIFSVARLPSRDMVEEVKDTCQLCAIGVELKVSLDNVRRWFHMRLIPGMVILLDHPDPRVGASRPPVEGSLPLPTFTAFGWEFSIFAGRSSNHWSAVSTSSAWIDP